MQFKATISFSGIISMAMGEVREISDRSLIDDLTKAGYIIPLEEESTENKKKSSKSTRKGKANEN